MRKFALAVVLFAGCGPKEPETVYVLQEVKIITTYEQPGSWGEDWSTIVEKGNGERITKNGRLGEPGDKFKMSLPETKSR